MTDGGSRPEVSVVMIFRDALPYFDESIRSVLAQTCSFELLLCDDGSSDGSTELAKEWAQREPGRIRYVDHPDHEHRGMSATRNLGVRAARASLVAFLDADDLWDPQHLADDTELLRRNPEAGMVCGQALVWHSWRTDQFLDVWTPLPWPPGTVVRPPRMLVALLLRGAYCTPTCNLLVRKSLLEEVSGADEQFTAIFEDQALLAKLHLAAPAVISGSRTARYRQHEESATARALRVGSYAPDRPNRSMEAFLRWLERLVEDSPKAASDAELRDALGSALAPYESPQGRARAKARLRLRAAIPDRAIDVVRKVDRRARAHLPGRFAFPRRLTPLSRDFGYERGTPVDRYYIERFLGEHAHVVAGRVLEVGDAEYTHRFGGDKVRQSDVLNVFADAPGTTFVDDLASGQSLPSDAFDCVILTQTLHLIYDMPAAVRTVHRILRPGGTVLATVPGISPVDRTDWGGTWYWSLTPLAAQRLFAEQFGEANVEVISHGNLVTSMAFLQGMALEELRPRELAARDPQFPMLVTVKAVRPTATRSPAE